jgi:mannose-6-phosphate isomerase class I
MTTSISYPEAAPVEAPPVTLASHGVEVKHILTSGVYMKAYRAPKNTQVRTKQFDEDHVVVLAHGSVVIKSETSQVKFKAPAHFFIPANTRVVAATLEDAVWYCIHPTEETDLEQLAEKY